MSNTEPPCVIETFRPLGNYERERMASAEPHVGNGAVYFRKYRVTIELIDERLDVLQSRLQELYDAATKLRTGNTHERQPLLQAAKEIGVKLESR